MRQLFIAIALIALTAWLAFRLAASPILPTHPTAAEMSAARSYAAVQLAYANHMTVLNRLPIEEASQSPEVDFNGLLTHAVWIEPQTGDVDALSVTPVKFEKDCPNGQCFAPPRRVVRQEAKQILKQDNCPCDPCLCDPCQCVPEAPGPSGHITHYYVYKQAPRHVARARYVRYFTPRRLFRGFFWRRCR